jgi:uncharacterized protein
MDNTIWVALITGLTAGGLSCMAVQGGLVTGSLARQLESEIQAASADSNSRGKKRTLPARHQLARPILIFLAAKLAAYTLLGALLGLAGSVFSLTPMMRGVLQIAIGIFMVGNALRILNIHPIFRYFSFEPPQSITRFIRRTSKKPSSSLTPVLLGILTVLIPCGIAQSMMAVAISSGSPLYGALIMFAFTVGTSPVFFILTYLATRLGALTEKYFMRIVAAALLVLGFLAFDSGLSLVGSPFSFTQSVQTLLQPSSAAIPVAQASDPFTTGDTLGAELPAASGTLSDVLTLQVRDEGYLPRRLLAPAGKTVTLNLVSSNTNSCARAFVIPTLNLSAILPETGKQTLSIPPQQAGSDLRFACSMGMYTGLIHFQ